tara:strand:- start:13883 stop:14143 length:261 start_codon:yes stop_codon:yes gene_type:complete
VARITWIFMQKRKCEIIAEQYLEVVATNDGGWKVELVIESMPKFFNLHNSTLRYTLGEFKSEESGDKFAESFRFLYDKSIFEYELM